MFGTEDELIDEIDRLKNENRKLRLSYVNSGCETLINLCKSRNLHCSITYQKINDISIEIYSGYISNYEKIYYTDGHINIDDALIVAITFLKKVD